MIIDVETAGLNAQTDALLELAAITVKMDDAGYLVPDQQCHFHIQPFEGANINPDSLKFNGIDIDNPLRGAVPENIAIPEMFKMVRKAMKAQGCQRAVIVAHNAAFDQGFYTQPLNVLMLNVIRSTLLQCLILQPLRGLCTDKLC